MSCESPLGRRTLRRSGRRLEDQVRVRAMTSRTTTSGTTKSRRSCRRQPAGWLATLLVALALSTAAGAAAPVAHAAPALAAAGPRQQAGSQTPGHVPRGYWLAASNGGVFAYGNATFNGGVGALNKPVVGMATTPVGNGYWLAASDGGIFSFDVPFLGSTGGIKLNKPVVSVIASPATTGYWLVASDGGVFNFGLPLLGSMGDMKLNSPVVGAAATPTGQGYWLVASDGGIFSFGDAAFYGGVAGNPAVKTVVGMAPTPSGLGYWLTAADGGIFSYGDATFFGSAGGLRLRAPIIGITGVPNTGPGKVGVFYYPWYGTPTSTANGGWRHWDQGGHTPPFDIGASYYPLRGAYSSTDTAIVDPQMAEIAAAGVNQVIVSWWGQGSYEDQALPFIQRAAAAHGLDVAIHFEPYGSRSTTGPADVAYLKARGISVFYAYRATNLNSSFWAAIRAQNPTITMFANGSPSYIKAGQGGLVNFALLGGFDGIYTYDPINFSGSDFGPLCALARANRLQCAPSVAPGFDGTRATSISTVRDRFGGATYDSMWIGAIAAAPEVVTITSYNEWHEGSQIEPAKPFCNPNTGQCYSNYTGDFGIADPQIAEGGYLSRTTTWTGVYRSTRTPGLP